MSPAIPYKPVALPRVVFAETKSLPTDDLVPNNVAPMFATPETAPRPPCAMAVASFTKLLAVTISEPSCAARALRAATAAAAAASSAEAGVMPTSVCESAASLRDDFGIDVRGVVDTLHLVLTYSPP
jgi:hypothetical protein